MSQLGPVVVPPGPERAAEPRRRLHPLSPLLHSAKMLAVILAAISVQGAVRLGLTGFIGVLLVVMCLAMAASAVSWLVTGYHVVGRELRIYDGVLVRRTRAIPLERLQAVELVRPLLARVFGLAELRLEVVGGGKTEAPLAYLTAADATELRERLLAMAARVGAPAAGDGPLPGDRPAAPWVPSAPPEAASPLTLGAPGAPAAGWPAGPPAAARRPPRPAARPLHTVRNRDVLVSQILTPPVMFLPVAVAMVVAQYVFGTGAWSLVVLASMLVAIIGVIQQPVRRTLSDWHFRLGLQESTAPGHAGLRVWHGLTETRSQTVPLRRIQAVTVIWPLLWRAKRWLRVHIDVAGYATGEHDVGSSDQLLPVGDLPTASRLVPVVLPGVDLSRLALAGVPRRARWVAPLAQPVLAAGCAEDVFATREGRLTRRLTLVPYARIQSVRVVQGPGQRMLGLASVYADTAGSTGATAAHRELADARWLAADLTRRARRARETGPAPTGPAPAGPASTGGVAHHGGVAHVGGDGDGPAGRPPSFGHRDHDEGDPHVGPADQDVDDPVLPRVDEGRGHRQRVGEQQRPPAAAHRPGEEEHDEQRERGVQ